MEEHTNEESSAVDAELSIKDDISLIHNYFWLSGAPSPTISPHLPQIILVILHWCDLVKSTLAFSNKFESSFPPCVKVRGPTQNLKTHVWYARFAPAACHFQSASHLSTVHQVSSSSTAKA